MHKSLRNSRILGSIPYKTTKKDIRMKIEIGKDKILIDFEGTTPRYVDNVTDIIESATDSWLKTCGRDKNEPAQIEVK